MIQPTVGRRVWYWPSAFDRQQNSSNSQMDYYDPKQPCDAGIAFVHGDRMVNLTVADHNGKLHARCSVPLVQEGDVTPAEGSAFAQWMPYQNQQARKDANAPIVAQSA